MKLSDKGLKRLLDVAFDGDEFYQSNALEVEFEPDDFVGGCCQNGNDHVVFTVEEAKKISTFFDVVECCAYGFKLSDEERILWEIIEKRIRQAENK